MTLCQEQLSTILSRIAYKSTIVGPAFQKFYGVARVATVLNSMWVQRCVQNNKYSTTIPHSSFKVVKEQVSD